MADIPLIVAPGGQPPAGPAQAVTDVFAGPDGMAAHDLSMVGLFLQADPIVKGVMILLFIASIACWAIILDKTVRITLARRSANDFAKAVKAGAVVAGSTSAGVGGRSWQQPHASGERFPSSKRAAGRGATGSSAQCARR